MLNPRREFGSGVVQRLQVTTLHLAIQLPSAARVWPRLNFRAFVLFPIFIQKLACSGRNQLSAKRVRKSRHSRD